MYIPNSIILLNRSPEGTDPASVETESAFTLATLPEALAKIADANLLEITNIAIKAKISFIITILCQGLRGRDALQIPGVSAADSKKCSLMSINDQARCPSALRTYLKTYACPVSGFVSTNH